MKTVISTLLTVALAIAGCSSEDPKVPVSQKQTAAETMTPEITGTVIETMKSGGYTYVQVDTGKEKIWAASPEIDIHKDEVVVVPPGSPMNNFHSKTLDRTFDLIYFVPSIIPTGAGQASQHHAAAQPTGVQAPTPSGTPATAKPDFDFSSITRPEDGATIAEIYAGKSTMSGKSIKLRGKIVKVNTEIMGKNWLHVQDGTGTDGSNDITVTTSAIAKVGDTVLVNGKLVLDRDFGYGYKYDLIVEDALLTVE